MAGARAWFNEEGALNLPGTNLKPVLMEDGDRVYLQWNFGAELRTAATKLVTTELLGRAKIAGLAYDNADGSRLVIDSDYSGKKRNTSAPCAGPFEDPGLKLKVW
jgi:alpha-N-arabinofuranosidase